MKRTCAAVFFAAVLLLVLLAVPASFAAPAESDYVPERGDDGFVISDFQPGQQEVSSMAVFGDQLYAGTLDWIGGGEVWSYSGASWTRVGMEGLGDSDNVAITSLAVFDDLLYAGTMNWQGGCQLWQYNGLVWSNIDGGGFGDVRNHAITSLAVFDGRLYAGLENSAQGCEVWRSLDGEAWSQVNANGFGDGNNTDVLSLAVFGNRLYAGTRNGTDGCELWRTGDGTTWGQVNADGFGDINNEGISSLVVYNSKIYAGTLNDDTGCELWSAPDGTTWGQVNTDGFGDENNVDASSLAVFKGRLYTGTDNRSTGCELWSWAESATWVQTNADGFGDPDNVNATCLQDFNFFLYVGTMGWEDGCEVWRTGSEGGPPYTDWTQVNFTGFAGATWYLAEGATAGGFETWILVQNPGEDAATVTFTFMTDIGEVAGPVFDVGPKSRISVNAADTVQTYNVSTKIVSDKPVVAERAVYYGGRICATGSVGATDPAPTWYLAEGASAGGFETWILVQNPQDEEATVLINYFTEAGVVFGPNLTIPPKTRVSVNVADTVQTYNVSTKVNSDKPVVAERAVYYGGRMCATGSVGVTDPAPTWYLAEGASAGGFETWILVQNPDEEAATVTLTYMTDIGEMAGPVLGIGPKSRISVNVADTVQTYNVSTKVESDKQVVAERAVYFNNRQCATGSVGVTDPATTWYLAEGATAGGFETWILVQNPGEEAATVTFTFMTDSGEVAGPVLDLGPKSRISVNVADTVQTYNVSTKVESDKQVVAERAVYYGGRMCATGSIGFAAE